MKKVFFAALCFAIPVGLCAQSAVDVYNLSQTEIRGTARFMSMGGAFTALGGDLSTLNQNPAGIGVYRRSEIGATLDISPRSINATAGTFKMSTSSTPVSCNNFGYIGSVQLNGAMNTFSWGASYNRINSFNRKFTAYNGNLTTSLSNYIADYTTASGVSEYDMQFDNNYNPYINSDIDWLSILSYSAGIINPNPYGGYNGLWQNGTSGNSYTSVNESGYVDEYAIDFGGNVNNVVMWGIGFGITDLHYSQTAYYDENLTGASVPSVNQSGNMTSTTVNGNGYFDLTNYRIMTGTGFNLKVGLIFKPVNEFRVGLAFHTPTWYTITNSSYAEINYEYYNPAVADGRYNPFKGSDYTEDSYYNFRLTSPWKFMVGAAYVLGSSAIISADYEFQAYNKMRSSYQGQFGDYVSDDFVNSDIQEYYKNANILRVGAEFRVTPSFSIRAGYNFTSTTASKYMLDGGEVLTAGTDPAFTMNRGVNAVSVGLGYRYKAFYIDGAYVYRSKKSTYKPFTDYGQVRSASIDLSENTNSIVISAGFKF